MVALVAALAVGGGMLASHYPAKSDIPDPDAPGGFAESKNVSWSMAEVALEGKSLSLLVKKNDCCGPGGDCAYIVTLSNGTKEAVWLKAADSLLALVRQAKDIAGNWRTIEYRRQVTCGNSRHRVALSPGRAFVWDVPSTTGPLQTKVRYALFGLERPIFSNEFDAKLSPEAFLLPDEFQSKTIGPDGTVTN